MRAQARRTEREAPQHELVAPDDHDAPELTPRDVLETLEAYYPDDELAPARGLVNGAAIGAAVWALGIVAFAMLG